MYMFTCINTHTSNSRHTCRRRARPVSKACLASFRLRFSSAIADERCDGKGWGRVRYIKSG